jgi:hypothetical protein
MSQIQRYSRIYDYINEYLSLIYDYYSKHVVSFLVTYYNLDIEETVWEDEEVFGGAYEEVGNLTGIKRNKILLLPVYYMEEISTSFDGQDVGYNKDNVGNFVIPSSYNFTPYQHDIIKMEQSILRPTNDIYPLYKVTGADISVNTDKRFWRLKVETFESETLPSVEAQVVNTYSFVEYDKKIHTLADAQYIAKLLVKDSSLREEIHDRLYDERSGFYFNEPVNP